MVAAERGDAVRSYEDGQSMQQPLLDELIPGDVVLVKASRSVGLEIIVDAITRGREAEAREHAGRSENGETA